MKYDALRKAGSTFLLVPALNHKIQDHPLKYMDSLVYGLLIYRTRRSKRERVAGIKNRLGIDRITARSSLKKLLDLGCVKQHPDGYEAVEPQGNYRCLFTWKKKPQRSWHSQFSYDKTFLPVQDSGLTSIQNAIYWRLVSLSVPAEGGCGHLMIGPGARVQSISNQYLAKGLRCSRKTVASGLKVLQAQEMIHVHEVKKGRRYCVGIHPIAQHVGKWRGAGERKEQDLCFEELFGQASNSPAKPDISYRPRILALLIEEGIPSKTAEEVAALVQAYVIPDADLKKILYQVRRDHLRNRNRNPNLPVDCGRLLLAELRKRGEAGEWRMYEGFTSTTMSLPEMQTLEFLNSVKACSEAWFLLRRLNTDRFVELSTGGRLPVVFDWDHVRDLAQAAGRNFSMFRDAVADLLFSPTNKMESDWLNCWTQCDVVPPIDAWPSDLIPLPEKGRTFISTLQKWAKEIAEFDDVTAANATNKFIEAVQNTQGVEWKKDPKSNMMLVLRCFQTWAGRHSFAGLIDQFFYE